MFLGDRLIAVFGKYPRNDSKSHAGVNPSIFQVGISGGVASYGYHYHTCGGGTKSEAAYGLAFPPLRNMYKRSLHKSSRF